MGFYTSKDGLYVYSTLDSKFNKFLTRKGRMYTHYSIKIQRWWRKILENKIQQQQAAVKIQKWWRQTKTQKSNIENEENSILIIPIFIMNKLISFLRYFLKFT
jgi:ABC-type lipoprotein release transport system permease subunit